MIGVAQDENMAMLLIAVLLKRLGGVAEITQGDIDDVAYSSLQRCDFYERGITELELVEMKRGQP